MQTRFLVFLCVYCLSCATVASEKTHGVHGHHHLSVLVGVTDIEGEGTNDTLGIDYEYRVSDFLGIGIVAEYAFEELDAWTVLAVTDLHVVEGLVIQVGPGVEHTSKHDLFVYRLGALYEFEFGRWTVSPQAHFDYHDGGENAVVLGLAFGVNF